MFIFVVRMLKTHLIRQHLIENFILVSRQFNLLFFHFNILERTVAEQKHLQKLQLGRFHFHLQTGRRSLRDKRHEPNISDSENRQCVATDQMQSSAGR